MRNEAIGLLVIASCFAVLGGELFLARNWSSAYFRSGVLLFRQRASLHSALSAPQLEEDLNLSFERIFWSPLTFRQLASDSVAFRERFSPCPIWLGYYIPVMHGRIRILHSQTIEVTGRSNWAMPLLSIVVMLRVLREAGFELAAVCCVFWVAMYGLQVMRFRQVLQVSRWSR